jgi:hypothetical protein
MRNLLFIICFFVATTLNFAQVNGPVVTFAESSFDFGDIVQGAKVERIYKFQNTGTEPLVVSEVVTTCGCTATKWSKEPILPGKGGEILATFDSAGKEGRKNQVITIISNASNSPSRITMVTNVIPNK